MSGPVHCRASSSAGTGCRIPFNSLKNSVSDSEVLSVWTPAAAKNGPGWMRMSKAELAPYV
jgi:hypothetical protein